MHCKRFPCWHIKVLPVSSLASFRRIPLQDIPCDSIEDTSKWCREAFQEKVNKFFLHHTKDKYFPAVSSCVIFLRAFCQTFFYRAYHRLHIFPALSAGYVFPRAYHRLHIFPRFPRVTYFSALTTGYIFYRAFRQLFSRA